MKRWRAPRAKPGELKVQWGKLPQDSPDMIFCHGGGGANKRDSALLHWVLAGQRPNIRGGFDDSLFDELEKRGYDLTTLKFSIQKKENNEQRQSD